jgi:uncharacterized membrane protein
MGTTAIVLVTISVLFHATWNMYLKEESRNLTFVVSFNAAAMIVAFPLAIWAGGLCVSKTILYVLPFLIASSVCNGLYYLFLSQAYKFGDFSIAYPVSRSAPVIVVTIASLFFGENPSAVGLVGIILVVAGCFLLPFNRLKDLSRDFKIGMFFNKMMAFALLTAVTTAGYSVFDKFGSKPLYAQAGIKGALGYMTYEWILTFAVLYAAVRIFSRQKGEKKKLLVNSKKAWLAASLMTFSYGFVMIAYQFSNVSYVVGFRQLSIVLGVVFAGLVLREKISEMRLMGVGVVVAGLIMIALA